MSQTMARLVSGVLVGAVVIAAIVGLVVWDDHSTPRSTHGVSVVGHNEARLPQGETMILLHQAGKSTTVWHITFNSGTVDFQDDSFWIFHGDHHSGTLCGVGCTTDVAFGWGDHFYVSLLPDGAADVKWPSGYDYRS